MGNPEQLYDDESHGDNESNNDNEDDEIVRKEDIIFEVGNEVIVKYHAKEQELIPQEEVWYPGTIIQKETNNHFTIKYHDDDEIENNVHFKYIRPQQQTQQNVQQQTKKEDNELSKKKKIA